MAASIKVPDTEIPLPPEYMWKDLDNSKEEIHANGTIKKSVKQAEALAFIGAKAWSEDVRLDFPFQWDGRDVTSITVRRLTTAQMGEIVTAHGSDFDQWDIFAAMTGLPASVLRGLEAGDGDQVTGVAYDFLPRSLKRAG